jgi:hypothetical protein
MTKFSDYWKAGLVITFIGFILNIPFAFIVMFMGLLIEMFSQITGEQFTGILLLASTLGFYLIIVPYIWGKLIEWVSDKFL